MVELLFDGTVKIDPQLVLHSTGRIVVAAETPFFRGSGYRDNVIVLDQKEWLPMKDGLLHIYASRDVDKLEETLDYEGTQSDRVLKQRFVSYVRNTEGHDFRKVHDALVAASREEDRIIREVRERVAAFDVYEELFTREFPRF